MKKFLRKLILFLLIFIAALSNIYGQCTPNTLRFLGGEPIYNTACANNSYQNIVGTSPTGSGQTYRWEVSFSGFPYSTLLNGSNVPITSSDLSKSDITNFILVPNSNASGDYRIRRIVANNSAGCTSTSEPVFLYYSQNQSSITGGTVSGEAITCSPASGSLLVTGNTGPVLRWESAPAGTGNWTVINNVTNTLSYTNLTESTCYRALIDNICGGTPGVIDVQDKYSSTFCVTVNSTPLVSGPSNQSVCLGSALDLSVTVTSVLSPSYQWRKNGVNINGAVSPVFNIPVVDAADAGLYDVVVSNTCGSVTSDAATITVSPMPTVNVPANSMVCPGTPVSASSFSSNPAGATYIWSNSNTAIGLAASGSGNVPAFTATNSSASPISATITVTPILNGCSGTSSTYTISVKPTPVATVPANSSVCSGATVSSFNFTSNPAGASFTWTNSNTAIGLAASGSGNVPSFTASNSTTSAITATITVTPVLNGCSGPPSSYTITVNPLPVIISAAATDESICDADDGTITINATGIVPLEYSINGGTTFVQNGGNFTGLAAGSYSVAVRNPGGCMLIGETVSVTSPGAPPAPNINPYINPVCQGLPFILSVNNPDPAVTYSWTGPAGFTAVGESVTRSNADPSMSGTYAVTATIGSCVSAARTFSITVNPLPAVTVPANMTYCEGSSVPAGDFTSTPAGATYTWTNSNTAIGLAASGSGNVPAFTAINNTTSSIIATITVTPYLNDCTGPSSTYTITINPLPELTVPANFTVCAETPVAATSFSSLPAGATYTWTNSNTGIGLPASGSGNVPAFTAINPFVSAQSSIISVTPFLNGCAGPTVSYTVTVNPLPRLNSLANLTVCSAASIPATNFSSSPGGATYSWSNSNTAIGLAASGNGNVPAFTATNNSTSPISATITVTPTLNGCTGPSSSYTITVNPLALVSVPVNSTVCSGTTITSSNFNSSPGGASFTWTNSNTAIGLAASGNGNVPSFTASNTTTSPITATITVTPVLNGCSGPASSYTIIVNPLPVITSAAATDESVCDANDGTITIVATGAAPLEYSINGGSTFVQNGGLFTGLSAASYSVVVRNATGCILVGPVLSVASPGAPPVPTVNPFISPVCLGTPLVLSIQNPDPAITYTWTGPSGFTAVGDSVSRPNADPSMSGTYAVTATIGSCVSAARIFTITVNPLPAVTVPSNMTYCEGSSVPAGDFTSTPAGATYTWTNSNTAIGLAASGSGNVPSFTAINNTTSSITATITVTPYLDNCTGPSSTYTITINPLPDLTVPANFTVCAQTPVAATSFSSVPADATYTWTNSNPSIGLPASGSGNVPAFTALNNTTSPASALITITPFLNGCAGPSSSYTITVKPLPLLSNIPLTQTICSESGTTEVTLSSNIPGTTFSWIATASSALKGYTANGTNIIPAQLITNTGSAAGTITYTIIPLLNGCAGPASEYTVVVNPLPTALISGSRTVCYGGSATLSVNLTGTAPWTITYTDGITPVTVSGISTNTYTFNVTPNSSKTYTIISVTDASACSNSSTGSAVLVQPIEAINATVSSSNINCYGAKNGVITVDTATGGFGNYEYSITGGTSWQSSKKFIGLAPGTYQVLVRDSEHPECITLVPTNLTISQPAAPLSLTYIRSDVGCFGEQNGSIKITVTGGSGVYSYNWSNGQVLKDLSELSAGDYSVTITDSKGCTLTETIPVKQPTALKISFVKYDISCFGNNDGSIDLSVSGGTLPYTYKWSNKENSEDINNLSALSYTVTVIDANGCSAIQNIVINEPSVLKVSLIVKNTTCKTSLDGTITASISGGTQPYSVSWKGLPQTGNTISNLRAGMYELLVKDAGGCTFTVTAEVSAGNCPPIAVNDLYKTDEEVPISGSVALNDFDQQGEKLTYTMTSTVKNGVIIFTEDGKFTYTPNVGFWETETVIYKVCNTSGLCATATLLIEVIPYTVVNLTPSLSNVFEGKKVAITARLMRPFKDDVIVRISYSGTAGKDRDYVLLDQSLSIRIPRGKVSTSEKITLAALTDSEQEGDEDVILQISATSDPLVRIGTGTIVIIKDVYPPDTSIPNPVNTEVPLNPDIRPDPLISPNGDGQGNEFFKIENLVSFPDNQVLIFNRWGNEVFRIKGYNESDRVFKGYANTGLLANSNSPLADGVYYYLITTNRIVNGQNISALNKGYLILKR